MDKYGLIGKDIGYSFSKGYFTKKFKNKGIDASYENFDIENIEHFPFVVKNNLELRGLNVTIPYKEQVMIYLDQLDKHAKKIGAVNTIKITKKGKLTGYNTDWVGFKKALKPHLKLHHKNALILGTGGASKAVAYALKKLDVKYHFVSRTQGKSVTYTYDNLSEETIAMHHLIINCTPLGTHPSITDCPQIPYSGMGKKHLLFDLIYNPSETQFLKNGKQQGASILNGHAMLELQAEKAWEIWNG